ncbi:desmoplakin [Betabaculovirus altermyunipunctae]|uniref:Desmoplakin n=1 Tax=Betabaculovirus altermyunipunctae TaxID=3051996 RepID=A0A1S5YE72_9BBAC|nr:desmoplakin [Betabaculovirus altermyunipunctae]AQQ80385.1 desmoplakin [Betabaculovirus altermyunipunctae]
MLTRYKGVDVNPHTVHNLIRTIVSSKQCQANDNDPHLRSIILSFRPDLADSALSTDRLLITALKDCQKKDVTYNYKYETTTTNNNNNNNDPEEHHVANSSPPDIFIRIWRLGNVEREEACVLAASVRDLCNSVLRNVYPDFDPDRDGSAATLLKLCTEARYTKRYAYEENQAMGREVAELERELLESRSKVAELLASFSNFKSEYEKRFNLVVEKNQYSENEVATLELTLLDRQEELKRLQDKHELLLSQFNETQHRLEEKEGACKEHLSNIAYLKSELNQLSENERERMVVLEAKHAETVRSLTQKLQLKETEMGTIEERSVQSSAYADEMARQLNQTRRDNDLLRSKAMDLDQEVLGLKDKLKSYHVENASLAARVKDLSSISVQDADSNAELQALNQKLKKECDQSLLQTDSLKRENEELKRKLEQVIREHDETTDDAERSYNLQKGEINRLRLELDRVQAALEAANDDVKIANAKIAEQAKTIDYCNYEIDAMAKLQNTTSTLASSSKEGAKTTKIPIKHKLVPDKPPAAKHKVAKKSGSLNWDVNKVYGVKNQEQLRRLIDEFVQKNKNVKEWDVYNKFLSCTDSTMKQLEENPEFQRLDKDFKEILVKQRDVIHDNISNDEESSLFSNV